MEEYIWQRNDWPQFCWNSEALLKPLGAARSTHGALVAQADRLSLTDQRDIYADEGYATSEIEGEILDRDQLRSSVAEQLGLPTAGLPHADARTNALAAVLIDATRNYDRPLTAERIWGWQAALFPTGYSGPSRLEAEMNRFIAWWNGQSTELDGVIRAGLAHLYFVTIHPFADGNGRIARVLTDMALAQDEESPVRMYSLSPRIRAVRKQYYAVLEGTQRGDLDLTQWLLWFIDTYRHSLSAALERIDRSLVIDRYYRRLGELALNDRQIKVMKKMIDAHPEGFAGGMTNRKYVAITGASSETAKRDLGDLVTKGVLQRGEAAGRATYYVLPDKSNFL